MRPWFVPLRADEISSRLQAGGSRCRIQSSDEGTRPTGLRAAPIKYSTHHPDSECSSGPGHGPCIGCQCHRCPSDMGFAALPNLDVDACPPLSKTTPSLSFEFPRRPLPIMAWHSQETKTDVRDLPNGMRIQLPGSSSLWTPSSLSQTNCRPFCIAFVTLAWTIIAESPISCQRLMPFAATLLTNQRQRLSRESVHTTA